MICRIEELESVFDSFYPTTPEPRNREMRIKRMEMLLDYLGHPERSFRSYHVAGSKGKGSTAAYLSAIISGSGRKCGLYTSPHLFSVRERFTLSGQFFHDREYIETCNELLGKVKDFSFPSSFGSEKPTEFEIYTAYGYMLFKATGCSEAVIETGLGGRLDATNTLHSAAAILTPIELEHTELLGNTIKEIAGEKAGIITSSSPVFSSCQEEEAEEVFRKRAEAMGAEFFYLPEHLSSFASTITAEGAITSFIIEGKEYKLKLRMASKEMAENAALAILAAEKLSLLSEEGVKRMENVQLPGRFEERIIEGNLVVIDTAHTPHSASSTMDSFLKVSKKERRTLIIALADGKKENEIIRILFPFFDRIIITKTNSFKKSNPERLYQKGKELFPDKDIMMEQDADIALDSALTLSSDILITGSFYLASEMERLRKSNES